MASLLTTLNTQTGSDDDALALKARQDRAAFAELYRRHFERVFRYLMAHTGSREEAQDLAAITFMAAMESLPRYEPRGKFLAWLLAIARNKAAMHHRTRKPQVPLESAHEIADPSPSPEALASRRLQGEQIARLLAGLPGERAEAIRLCIFSDLSAVEAGQVLGKSAAAVKMLVHRGLKDLRSSLLVSPMEEQ